MKTCYLHLEDGTTVDGESFGFYGEADGEVVFSTGMTGYPQSLTDPSFAGQILVFTYPLLGNYGIPASTLRASHLMQNFESERIWVRGIVVSSDIETPSHYQMDTSLSDWLTSYKIPGITHIDTRALTLKLREKGVMRGRISKQRTHRWIPESGKDVVSTVSFPKVMTYKAEKPCGKNILVIDCGVKHGILRALLDEGYNLIRIPWNKDPLEFLSKVDGVVSSNGPGDPKNCEITIEHIRTILKSNKPFLGICLGHQLTALAIGADTYKLSYGHRGLNQPCQDIFTKKAFVTSQNHGYAVNTKTIPKGFCEWFINLNDGTNEGMKHEEKPVWSTQFHPEGNPGPFDTNWIFSMFKK